MTRILVTGAAGAVGSALVPALVAAGHDVLATDIRVPEARGGARWETLDVRDGTAAERLMRKHGAETVVHLASIVTPGAGSTPEREYQVDVEGSRNVLAACLATGARRLVVTSSGAAYGYHADNPAWLTEDAPLRGNDAFPYARHKRLVEEMLAEARRDRPELEQVVLRVGTILGPGVENQITALFRKPRMLGVSGSDSPFVFIWTEDLARILIRAVTDGPAGVYNVAGDGAVSVDELARRMGKPCLKLPAWLLRGALAAARPLGLSRYGPEQVGFLQHRPVLDNSRLKSGFGYAPQVSSADAFARWWAQAR